MVLDKYNNEDYPFRAETERIIGLCMKVHSTLGFGFLEAVYQEALEYEFRRNGVTFIPEKELVINYDGYRLKKTYKSDFICYDNIILELKAVDNISNEHYSQVLNYLKATGFKLGLLVNFGSKSLQFKRIINNFEKK
ncbi:MAG: GxxExxY protein [Ignavibacteriae bacterium]|nr:GxxExxY protein [Ignavibacteriota bacterium]